MTMTAERLRSASMHQVGMLVKRFESLDVAPDVAEVVPVPPDRRAGFVAIRCADAANAVRKLRARNLFADFRGDILRLGPAPYISDQQLLEAGEILRQVFRRA
jgi:kynureninase